MNMRSLNKAHFEQGNLQNGYTMAILEERGSITIKQEELFKGQEFVDLPSDVHRVDHAFGMGWRKGTHYDATGIHPVWYRPKGL